MNVLRTSVGLFFSVVLLSSLQAAPQDISSLLEGFRAEYELPALAAAVFDRDGIVALGATGVRKSGSPIEVTLDDPWHLGSETKAMTATLAGTFVAEGKLSWTDKVITFFPELANTSVPQLRDITVSDLLSHRAGFRANLPWADFDRSQPFIRQREKAVRDLLTASPEFTPGSYHYSNAGYVIVGAVLERIGKKPWEQLMVERLFRPLGMKIAGFGGVGTPGKLDAPWGHRENGKPVLKNGPARDNPPVMAPAGRVHASVRAWAKFLIDQLRGAAGEKALLPPSIYTAIQTPHFDGNYAYGWGTARPPWAQGGKVLTHAGSNTMNYAVCWLSVDQGFGVLLCTNQSGKQASAACRKAGLALIRDYQNQGFLRAENTQASSR